VSQTGRGGYPRSGQFGGARDEMIGKQGRRNDSGDGAQAGCPFRQTAHVEVDNPPAMVGEHDENEEHAEACGGNREEVEGDEISDMVVEERPPGL
jgi:hypothetical protein